MECHARLVRLPRVQVAVPCYIDLMALDKCGKKLGHVGRGTTVDVFSYLDYREFLRDAFAERKSVSSKYSHGYFANRAGVGSPSYLKAVMDGKRNLSADTARGFARAFGLGASATRFFVELVAFNQARTAADREYHYDELSRLPKYKETRQLERSQYEYYSRWYCVVVRELVGRPGFREDPEWIARQIRPRITSREASQALSLLLALGLVARDDDGVLFQTQAVVTTGPQLRSLAVRSFHREMLHRAAAALDDAGLEEREVGGVTLRLTKSELGVLKRRMHEFRQEVIGHEGGGEGPEAVFHFSFQLFPVSDYDDGENDD